MPPANSAPLPRVTPTTRPSKKISSVSPDNGRTVSGWPTFAAVSKCGVGRSDEPQPAAAGSIETVRTTSDDGIAMSFPIKVCVVCSEEFELKPDKPGFANRCPQCSAPEATAPANQTPRRCRRAQDHRRSQCGVRREAMRELLYSKDRVNPAAHIRPELPNVVPESPCSVPITVKPSKLEIRGSVKPDLSCFL